MTLRILPDELISQIAAGEVVERPASVVKELVENALDAGADQIVIDVTDGGRTMISVTDNGHGMSKEDLPKSVMRHATSKLPDDDLLNINFMGFRGEALPSIASVSDMTIDTFDMNGTDECGWSLDCNTQSVSPSSWNSGTRVRVKNLFGKMPARLKFLRSDRAEMMAIVEVVKKLALARTDVGFVLNQKWRYPKNQPIMERIIAVMGMEAEENMLSIDASDSVLHLTGFTSKPTLRRASGIDQYLFVNGRPVKDKVLTGALRAGYLDVMSSREFPLCALYLTIPVREVDVNVSPAKTDVHFLEPTRVRSLIVRALRDAIGVKLNDVTGGFADSMYYRKPDINQNITRMFEFGAISKNARVSDGNAYAANWKDATNFNVSGKDIDSDISYVSECPPLGRPIGQIGNKYILSEIPGALVIVDQHAAHERIIYEQLRTSKIKMQPLLVPIAVKIKPEEVAAILEIAKDLNGLSVQEFGDGAIAIVEKPVDWDMDWEKVLRDIASEVLSYGHSSGLAEKLHLKLANYACHHSVRAGQSLDLKQMDALLRDIESTSRAGQCNHGRPVYKIIPFDQIDLWFERT